MWKFVEMDSLLGQKLVMTVPTIILDVKKDVEV